MHRARLAWARSSPIIVARHGTCPISPLISDLSVPSTVAAQAEDLATRLAEARDACDERDAELDDLRGDLAAARDSLADLRAEVDAAEADTAQQARPTGPSCTDDEQVFC